MVKFKTVNVIEKSLCSSIKNLIKNMHTKNEGNRTIGLAVITPTTLKNSISRNTHLMYYMHFNGINICSSFLSTTSLLVIVD